VFVYSKEMFVKIFITALQIIYWIMLPYNVNNLVYIMPKITLSEAYKNKLPFDAISNSVIDLVSMVCK
jgi:hypothetical protein